MHKLILGLWIALVVAGFSCLLLYSHTPGRQADARPTYPQDSGIKRDPTQASLLIFGHPHCPCSKASVGELERLMPHLKSKVRTVVVFVKPAGQTEDWAKEDLWQRTSAIPGVETMLDIDGVEAAKFGAFTSGQAFLYDQSGDLVFRGGITALRGHMGDNRGSDSIISFVESGKVIAASTPVFGCSLKNPERKPAGSGVK